MGKATEETEITDSQEERRNGDERSFLAASTTKGHEDTKITKRAAAVRFAAEGGLPRCKRAQIQTAQARLAACIYVLLRRGCRRAARADESHGPPFAFVPPFLL